MKRAVGIMVIIFMLLAGLMWLGYEWATRGPAPMEPPAAAEASAAPAATEAEAPEPAGSKFIPVDLSNGANTTIAQAFNYTPDLPIGDVTLGGVPFHIPTTGRNCWSGINAAGTVSLEIPVGVHGVYRVDTLINSLWGQEALETTQLEFFGDQGAYAKKVLVGGADIRDWNDATSINTINNTTTVRVWEGQGVRASPFDRPTRMDKQRIVLPKEFRTQTLVRIKLTDSGAPNISRALFYGVTVSAVGGDSQTTMNAPSTTAAEPGK